MLERWSPRAEMERLLEEVDRLMGETSRRGRLIPRGLGLRPGVDVYETTDDIIVKAMLPGAAPEDVNVTLEQNMLTIRGHYGYRMPEEEAKNVTWHCREIPEGEFAETITVPAAVNADQARASFEHGILTLRLPKTAETRARRIPIQVSD